MKKRITESWSRRPSLRKNGQTMHDVKITFAIGREDAAIIVAYRRSYSGELPDGRRELVEGIGRFLREKGAPSFLDIEGLENEEEAMAEAYAVVDRLMPELAGK